MRYPLGIIGLTISLFLTVQFSSLLQAQIPAADQAQALLQEVKARELERIQAAKMREVERLNEDVEKDRKEADDLKSSLAPMNAAATDSTNRLAQLNARKKQLAKMMEVVALQIDAEALKAEGLKMLSDAQEKSVAAMGKRIEETQAKGEMEKAKLNPAALVLGPSDKARAELERERLLERNERATSTARSVAREAMAAATAKLQISKAADDKARTRAGELGIPILGNPSPTQETVEPLKDIDPQSENIPIALPNQ